MDNVLISIGPFAFYATAPSFNMLRRTLELRWSEQDRVSRAPAGQFIGAQNMTIDLNGTLYPDSFVEQGVSSRGLLELMTQSANSGDVHSVVSMTPNNQTGTALGLFYIRSIQNEKTWFGADGAKKIDFQVTIKAYGQDSDAFTGTFFT